MNIDLEAIRLTPGQSLDDALFLNQVSPLATYLARPEGFEPGSVVLAPAYRLEEVEEIVEPEKPGVPVEPYVGLTFEACGIVHTVVGQTLGGLWVLVYFDGVVRKDTLVFGLFSTETIDCVGGYPHTPSTPAVTRKVKKWVKIEHPEVPSDGIA